MQLAHPPSTAGGHEPGATASDASRSAVAGAWDVISSLAVAHGGDRPDALQRKQRIRWQRFQMAVLTTVLVAVILVSFVFINQLPLDAYYHFLGFAGAMCIGFGWMHYSGLNLRFRDPSLTLPMMIAALGALLYVMWRATGGREIISLLYILPFVFGTLRLTTRQLVWAAALTLAADFWIMRTDPSRAGETTHQLDLLRWAALACLLMWFAFMGGFLSNLRRQVHSANNKLAQAFEAIKHLATHDELTGVFNRRQLVEMVKSELARGERYATPWSVIIVDIDFFKRVNDTLGHTAGDIVLREFAQAVERGKRPTDTFGRYGGEEFMLLLAQTRLEQARLTAERLRQMAEQLPFAGLDPAFRVTISAGVAEHRTGEDWQATIQRADEALYRAKQAGRNRVELSIDYEATVNMSRTQANAVFS
jgi:diguanylate cyclase